MKPALLVYVRSKKVYPVPPVPTLYWTPEDWEKTAKRVTEPLSIRALGYVWVATGQRNERGELLYTICRCGSPTPERES